MTKLNEGIKFDEEKLRYDLVPFEALEEVVKVLTFGSKKYSARDWEKGMKWGRVYAALLRHITAWFRGEKNDSETGLNHLAHAVCCCLFLLHYQMKDVGEDDRPRY